MVEIAITGGIGAGKSTVGAGLVSRGAVLIDADAIVRELQLPGQPVFEDIVKRWGNSVVSSDGTLNRAALAVIAFSDEKELAALNAIVHPAVALEMTNRRAAAAEAAESMAKQGSAVGSVVVLDIPLLVRADGGPIKADYQNLAGIVVVDVDPEVAVHRLVNNRGFDEADARARIANQASRQARVAMADYVIDNSGSRSQLERQIDACWSWACSLT